MQRLQLRRARFAYLTLTVAAAAVALVLSWRFDLGVPKTLAALLPTAAGLYLTWVSFRATRQEAAAGKLDLPGVADQLAVAVARQWQAEAAWRRLNDPYPLPVRLQAAPADLVETWTVLQHRCAPAARLSTGNPRPVGGRPGQAGR